MANYLRFVSPDMLHWTRSGDLMMMVILGGSGTLLGPIFGAAVLVSLESYLASVTENWQSLGNNPACDRTVHPRRYFGLLRRLSLLPAGDK